MQIQISKQMKRELEEAAHKIFSGEVSSLELESNGAIKLSATDNGGEKVELTGGTIYVKCDELLGNSPLSSKKMISQ